MTDSELSGIQFKVTEGNELFHSLKPLVFSSPEHLHGVEVGVFLPFRRTSFDYSAEDVKGPDALVKFSAPVPVLRDFLDAIGSVPGIADGGVDSLGSLSFMIVHSLRDSTIGFESILDDEHGTALFLKMRETLGAVRETRILLEQWACALFLRPREAATDVTDSVLVGLSNVRHGADSRTSLCTVQIMNISTATLVPPLSLVLHEAPELEIINYDGVTCVSTRGAGWRYIDCRLSGSLDPGRSVEQEVVFRNLGSGPITIAPRVLSGPGER